MAGKAVLVKRLSRKTTHPREECGKLFKSENDKLLECEYCEKHYCIKCLQYKSGEYEAMQKPGCMWFCIKCKPKVEKNN